MSTLHPLLHDTLAASAPFMTAFLVVTVAATAAALLFSNAPRLSAVSRHSILAAALLAPIAAALLVVSGVAPIVIGWFAGDPTGSVPATVSFGITHVVSVPEPWVDWRCTFFGIWAAVAVALLLRAFVHAFRWSREAARADEATDPILLEAFVSAAEDLVRLPRLAISAVVPEPMVVGWISPTVLLSLSHLPAAGNLTPLELQAVLAHEVEHIRRHDNVMALLQELATAMFWFDPLHWIARRRMLDLRERACDERVLERGSASASYISAIAKSCHAAVHSPAVACMSGFHIRERIDSIMSYASDRLHFISNRTVRTTAILVAVTVVLGFGALAPPPSIANEAKDEYRLDVALARGTAGQVHLLVAIRTPDGSTVPARVVTQEGQAATITSMAGDLKLKVEVPNAAVGALATLEVLDGNAVTARASARIYEKTAPALAPPPPGYERVGGDVKAPSIVSRVEPQFTEEARALRIAGIAIVEALIGEDGQVKDVKIVKDLPYGLGQAAADAIRQWTFTPATKDGKPIGVVFNLTVNFKLDDAPKQ
ncbi:MAG: M56 family metallopeptidase [Thermoanaerobaculia bacterium]